MNLSLWLESMSTSRKGIFLLILSSVVNLVQNYFQGFKLVC